MYLLNVIKTPDPHEWQAEGKARRYYRCKVIGSAGHQLP